MLNLKYHTVRRVSGQNQCYKWRICLIYGRFGRNGQTQVLKQTKRNKYDFCTLDMMFEFCGENERNSFSAENWPVGFYTDCLLKACMISSLKSFLILFFCRLYFFFANLWPFSVLLKINILFIHFLTSTWFWKNKIDGDPSRMHSWGWWFFISWCSSYIYIVFWLVIVHFWTNCHDAHTCIWSRCPLACYLTSIHDR